MIRRVLHNIFVSAGALLCFSGCNFLNVEQIGKSDIESFFTDVHSLEAAVNGAYNLTYKYYDWYFILYAEVAGDMVEYSSTNSTMRQQYDFISSESEETTPVGYLWRSGYEIINNANMIIQYGPGIAAKYPAQKDRINNAVAQAYFLRALLTLDISLCYSQHYTYTSDAGHDGAVVMKRQPEVTAKLMRSTVKETYNSIIEDIITAKNLFSGNYTLNVNYASPIACEALLARVCLYMEDYRKAYDYADGVITSSGLSLTPREKYEDMFCSFKENGPEAILRLNGYSLSATLNGQFIYNSPKMYVSAKLAEVFKSSTPEGMSDVRERLTRYKSDTLEVSNVCMKYTITDADADKDRHYDPFILRLSEMYLVRAESACALGMPDQASSDIAELRARAYGIPKDKVIISYSTLNELSEIVAEERVKELFLEGHRLFDITRRKEDLRRDPSTNSSVKEIKYPDDRFILPIPLTELDANPALHSNPINSTKQ